MSMRPARRPHHCRIETGQGRDASYKSLDRGVVMFAAQEILQIVALRVALDRAQRFAIEWAGLFAHRSRHRGKARDPAERCVAPVAAPAEVQHRRDHHKAADADALFAELAGKLRRAEASVALTGDECLRHLPSGLLDPFAHKGRKHVDIAIDRPELLAHVVTGIDEAAVAGAHRIDEHQIGEVEPGFGIGNNGRGRRGSDSVQRQSPRPYRAKLHVRRRCARATIEHEGEGATCRLDVGPHIGDIGDLGLQLAFAIVDRDRAGGRLEAQRPAG